MIETSAAIKASAAYPASPSWPIRRFWWLWVPILWMIFQFIIEATLSDPVLSFIHSENGLHENLQFFILFAAFIIAARTFLRMDRKAEPGWLVFWMGLATFCIFFNAGEEIDWGQTWLHWQTPAEWAKINSQQEMNLHNTTQWLNRIPRHVLAISIFAGGLLIPGIRRWKPNLLPRRFAVIYPPSIMAVTAIIYVVLQLVSNIGKHRFDARIFIRSSEVFELYMYYFVLLYIIVLSARLLQYLRQDSSGSTEPNRSGGIGGA